MKYVVVAVAAFVAVGATAPSAARSPAIVPAGISVGGVLVGGLSSESARALVRETFAKPLRLRFESESWLVRPEGLGVQSSVDDAVSRALHTAPRSRIELRVAVSRREIRAYVDYLNRRFSQEPEDARLLGVNGLAPTISDGRAGRRVARWLMESRIVRALHSPTRRTIAVPTKPVPPSVTRDEFGSVIVIGRESHRLRLFDGTRLVREFGVATGQAEYPTPLGTFSIATMQRDPWWIPPKSDWAKNAKPIPPGPGNPLGTRWMGLDQHLVGIHGTPDAASIGFSASHGCVRMRIADAAWLFERVEVGTPVVITAA